MTPTAARSSVPPRSVHARRQAVLDEVTRIWEHLPGPTGHLLADVTDDRLIAGIAPAAACYALPPEARSADTVPPWWTWRPSSWSAGHRRDELVLAAAFGLAAIDAELRHHAPTAVLRVVGQPDTVVTPTRDRERHAKVIDLVQAARNDLVDYDQMDPARSTRPTALPSLVMAAAVYFLPAEMRELSRTGVPFLWAWPSASWRQLPRRIDEQATATAMTLAALEIYDRPLSVVT